MGVTAKHGSPRAPPCSLWFASQPYLGQPPNPFHKRISGGDVAPRWDAQNQEVAASALLACTAAMQLAKPLGQNPRQTAEQIKAYCREALTGYKQPRQIEFRAELPKTNVGKILRRELRDESGK